MCLKNIHGFGPCTNKQLLFIRNGSVRSYHRFKAFASRPRRCMNSRYTCGLRSNATTTSPLHHQKFTTKLIHIISQIYAKPTHQEAKRLTKPGLRLPCGDLGGECGRDVEHRARRERAALERSLHSQRRRVLSVEPSVPEAPHDRLRHPRRRLVPKP